MADETNITEAQTKSKRRNKRRMNMLMQMALLSSRSANNAAVVVTPPSGTVGLDFSSATNSQYLIIFPGVI